MILSCPTAAPAELLQRCSQLGVCITRYALIASLSRQTLSLFEKCTPLAIAPAHSFHLPADCHPVKYGLVRAFRCSTSRFGISQLQGSNGTPLGLHCVAQKIGGGWPVGTAFKSRQPVGFSWKGLPDATITSRILRLEGMDPGFNRGGKVDSFRRFIYIHGTGDEPALGKPASCGCIHLAADDLIPLFDWLPTGSLVWIGNS